MRLLYADEDFNLRVVEELRLRGHDVQTAYAAGRAKQKIPDVQVLAYATGLGRNVLTHNRWDYIRLQKTVLSHAGILACSRDTDFSAQADKIHKVLLANPDLSNQLIRINKT
jgi:hypothetical protein